MAATVVVVLLAAVGGAAGAVVFTEGDDGPTGGEPTATRGEPGPSRGSSAGPSGNGVATERSFVREVDLILADSRPAFREINDVAVEIRDGTGEIAETRSRVDSVVANRSARLAATNSLEAPTAEAAEVRERLALAFRRALDNNRDFQQATDSQESGDSHRYLREAYEESYDTSKLARAAKQDFADAYNNLRAGLGLASDVTAEF